MQSVGRARRARGVGVAVGHLGLPDRVRDHEPGRDAAGRQRADHRPGRGADDAIGAAGVPAGLLGERLEARRPPTRRPGRRRRRAPDRLSSGHVSGHACRLAAARAARIGEPTCRRLVVVPDARPGATGEGFDDGRPPERPGRDLPARRGRRQPHAPRARSASSRARRRPTRTSWRRSRPSCISPRATASACGSSRWARAAPSGPTTRTSAATTTCGARPSRRRAATRSCAGSWAG